MNIKEIILNKEAGKRAFLLGNEAIVRGALEGNISFFAAYPGTPSSEILDTFSAIAKDAGVYVEVSSNEKIAYEAALGASWSGLRSMTSMKHVGLNVAADAFMSTAMNGVKGGFVIVVADDPSMWSSQNEQDTRLFAKLANLPVVEPSSPDEARLFAKELFELSEKFDTAVVLRSTTRLSHMRGEVVFGPLPERTQAGKRASGDFSKNPEKFVNLPLNARILRLESLKRIEKIREEFNHKFNYIEGDKSSKVGVIASGLAYAYVKEALSWLDINDVKILKLGTPFPVPFGLLNEFFNGLERAIIVEELEPVVEEQVKTWAFDKNIKAEIRGKDLVPRYYELSTDRVVTSLAKFFGIKSPVDIERAEFIEKNIEAKIPRRPLVFCPACPHRNVFYVIKKVTGYNGIYPSDIGCYTLGYYPPMKLVDTSTHMGSSIGLAHGISKALEGSASKKPIIATIGDSTFFHAGLPALANAIYNRSNFILFVLDNRTTAMTGHQPHPGTGYSISNNGKEIKIEDIAKAMGADYVEVVDPYDMKATEQALRKALSVNGVSFIVARRECALLYASRVRRSGQKFKRYVIDEEKCTGCKTCILTFGCPAISWNSDKKKAFIQEDLCYGCGSCVSVCPFNAIHEGE
ncbi:indolepyruvate ferredoxin oxidoreductase subunit alpha [Fervidicoccus fontis]|nr:indolepyruvate ferredoxin oxidoreductase subunit alpha [Fervidicoccus fontis]